jgi:multidrug resistance efflux pump
LNSFTEKVESLDSYRLIVERLESELEGIKREKQKVQDNIAKLQEGIEYKKDKIKISNDIVIKVPIYENEYNKIKSIYEKRSMLDYSHFCKSRFQRSSVVCWIWSITCLFCGVKRCLNLPCPSR